MSHSIKNIIIALLALAVLGLGVYLVVQRQSLGVGAGEENTEDLFADVLPPPQGSATGIADGKAEAGKTQSVLGKSAGGRDIIAYHFGQGADEVLFVGGVHGGYSWNTSLVLYEAMNYLETNKGVVPENVRLTIVPVLNPDGLSKVVQTTPTGFSSVDVAVSESVRVSGRFNANNVDLNRNFDCDWQANAKWQDKDVSGGSATFSEPEARVIRDYIQTKNPKAVVVWYSAAGGVFASNCHNGVPQETRTLVNVYASASGYPAHEEFDFYEVTGDMTNWLAKEGVSAISVLLTDHTETEWEKNRKGIEALLKHYAQ